MTAGADARLTFTPWVQPPGGWPPKSTPAPWRPLDRGEEVLAFDCETFTRAGQPLAVLCFRLYAVECCEEGIAYPEGLSKSHMAFLRRYVNHHQAEVVPWASHMGEARRELVLIPVRKFLQSYVHRFGFSRQASVVTFNGPFDLSRLAGLAGTRDKTASAPGPPPRWGAPAGRHTGAFTLNVAGRYWDDGRDRDGEPVRRPRWQKPLHRSDLRIAHRTQGGAFVDWNGIGKRDDWVAPGFEGRFVDVATLSYALSGTRASLEGAYEKVWGIGPSPKVPAAFGKLDERLVDHCRADVAATVALYRACATELERHRGVELDPTKLYSPGGVAQSYLRRMGVVAPAEKFTLPVEVEMAAARRRLRGQGRGRHRQGGDGCRVARHRLHLSAGERPARDLATLDGRSRRGRGRG